MAGIYLHIPFCKQACSYCDFHFSVSQNSKITLLDSLADEILLQKKYLGENAIINTIYFGGGTPSLLSAKELRRIFSALQKNFTIDKNAEITLEANPDDLTKKKLQELKSTPVNRLSIGVQSFFENDLRLMNRAHSVEQAEKCIYESIKAGFENITIDLIYGTPGLTNANWKKNLKKFFAFDLPHLSAYSLTVEKNTPLEAFIRKGKVKSPDEKQSAEQFEILMDEAEKNNFLHYEISNFCKPGFHSRHNSNYWTGAGYLGIGPSAHSFNGTSRQWNVCNNYRYIKSINQGIIPCEIEMLTTDQQFNEFILTRLRTSEGIDLKQISERFGKSFCEQLIKTAEEFVEKNQIIKEKNFLKLSPEGKLFADHIASELFRV